MKQQKKYLWGFWVLCVIILLRTLFLAYSYYKIQKISDLGYKISAVKINTAFEIALLVIIVMEAFIYWLLRYRIQNELWVRLHTGTLFFTLIIIPIIMMGVFFIAANYLGMEDYALLRITLSNIRFYLFWLLLITGHIFFVLTLVKSLKAKKEINQKANTTEILDEFSNS